MRQWGLTPARRGARRFLAIRRCPDPFSTSTPLVCTRRGETDVRGLAPAISSTAKRYHTTKSRKVPQGRPYSTSTTSALQATSITTPPHPLASPPPHYAAFPTDNTAAAHASPPPPPSAAATLAYPTAHGTPKANIPLLEALTQLGDTASSFVSQSRLQLALRSLESPRPIVRVGILGSGPAGFAAAKRITRLLLADPLGPEEEWERELKIGATGSGGGAGGAGDERAVLFRLSEEEGRVVLGRNNPLLREAWVGSRVLRRNGIEVLVAHLNLDSSAVAMEEGSRTDQGHARRSNEALETVVVPVLQSTQAGSVRAGFVRFPVHKAIVVGDGLRGALAMEGLRDAIGHQRNDLVKTVAQLAVAGERLSDVDLIDISRAETAFEAFRRDVSTGPAFGDAWQDSGLSDLSVALSTGTSEGADGEAALRIVNALVSSLLASTRAAIAETEVAERTSAALQTLPDETRHSLQSMITQWSQVAHTELQRSLAQVFESATWSRTSFPRVLWRIDDVPYAAAAALRTHFLVETEALLAYLSGRLEEAGFVVADIPLIPADVAPGNLEQARPASLESLAKIPSAADDKTEQQQLQQLSSRNTTAPIKEEFNNPFESKDDSFSRTSRRPWPLAIDARRQTLLTTLIPPYHARAQALVLQCLGTIGTGSALGAWYVAATAGTGVYEAGAVVAFGIVWALRRLQRLWGAERATFEGEVREQGRLVLGDVEARLRAVVRDGRRVDISEADEAGWTAAKMAVEKAQSELEKLAR